MNPWGFVIKSLDLLSLECFDKSGRPVDNVCSSSEKIREDFKFLFEKVTSLINLKLENLSENWDLPAAKNFPKKKHFNRRMKNIQMMAMKLASIYLNNPVLGKSVFERCKLIFAKKLAMYESWKMEQFFTDYWKPLIIEASSNINESIVENCENESEVCKQSLITAYANLYLPFYAVRPPIVKLGMGQFLSYFSRFVTQNRYGYFLISNMASTYESIIEKYLVKIFDNVANNNDGSFNISAYELVKILQLPQPVFSGMRYAPYVMKKFGCSWTEQEKLSLQWLNWVKKDEKTMSNKNSIQYPPCNSYPDAQSGGFDSCCNAITRLKDQLEPILKIMKYAAQPPHFIETDEEMSMTFGNATFLGYPLKFPLKSSWWATEDMTYGDGTINYNPKIPFCQYSGNPPNPKKTNCNIFARSITNAGLGYNFNGAKFWSLFRETPYTNTFSKIMYPKESQGTRYVPIRDDLADAYLDAGVRMPESSGPSNGLTIALHAVNLYNKIGENATFKTRKNAFKVMSYQEKSIHYIQQIRIDIYLNIFIVYVIWHQISIHDPLIPAELRGGAIHVAPGYELTVMVTPMQEVMDTSGV